MSAPAPSSAPSGAPSPARGEGKVGKMKATINSPSPLAGEGGAQRRMRGRARSSLNLPRRRAILIVLNGNAHGIKFIANAVRLFPIFIVASQQAIFY